MKLFSSNQLSKSYGHHGFQLKNISFSLGAGQITGVVGENGNGKTTLLRIIAGDLSYDTGEVFYFEGKAIDGVDWEEIKGRIAYIPQRIPRWYGALRDNLLFQASINNIGADKADEIIDDLVLKLGLEKYIHLKWTEISTGYRLRFQLAKMLIGSPDLLVLDEPIANLDIKAQNKFLSDLRDIVSEEGRNVSVILSSQQLHEIENVADSILFLKAGNLVYAGDVNKIGEEREENEFELQGEIGEEALNGMFENIRVTSVAKTFHIKAPLSVDASEFLKTILNNGVKVSYFRDISSSTRKLFNQ